MTRCARYAVSLTALALAGCGSAPNLTCTVTGFTMSAQPAEGALPADHTMPPPGNQEQFVTYLGSTYGPNCASNSLLHPAHSTWTTADPLNISISSADDATNGLVTCTGSTQSSVTSSLTEAGITQSRIVPVLCK